MRQVIALVVTLCVLAAQADEPVAVEATAAIRDALREAAALTVYHGLPGDRLPDESTRRAAEIERLAQEAERTGRPTTEEIGGYTFYLPATVERQPGLLQNLLMHPKTYSVYGGPKRCGGFHPDYAVTWQRGEITYHALICLTCHEIRLSDGSTNAIYDMAPGRFEMLRGALAGYK